MDRGHRQNLKVEKFTVKNEKCSSSHLASHLAPTMLLLLVTVGGSNQGQDPTGGQTK